MKGHVRILLGVAVVACFATLAGSAFAFDWQNDPDDFLSAGGSSALFGPRDADTAAPGNNNPQPGIHDAGRGGVTYANDPCHDPPAPSRQGVVQSETEVAVLNAQGSVGKKIVVGYNDSLGFYDNREGLSGFAYSTDGGNSFIDGGGLPPVGAADRYFGDPVVIVHQPTQTFYFASIYANPNGIFTLSVNRGRFMVAPPMTPESESNTRCAEHPEQQGVPDPPKNQKERIAWDRPVEAVAPPFANAADLLDKEWLYVDQRTGTLYLTYTRFTPDGQTPIEMVRCVGCAFKPGPLTTADWTPPTVIVANEALDFNQATQPVTTPTGRVIVTWIARTFAGPGGTESQNRIEIAYSDNDGVTWSPEQTVAVVNPQGEPIGYNRNRATILNAPYIVVSKGEDDGIDTAKEKAQPGFGNVYIAYFSGKTPLPISNVTKAADIFVSRSTTNGTTWGASVKVNDDNTVTTHLFPSVQVNKNGSVFVGWIDRRNDPIRNVFNDTWAAVSRDHGLSFGHSVVQTDVATTWFVRTDARPNMGDYNSSELLGFNQFVQTWADGRFLPPFCTGTEAFCFVPGLPPTGGATTQNRTATPDTVFKISNGLGVGGG